MSERITVKKAVGVLRDMLKRPSMKGRAIKLLQSLVDTHTAEGSHDQNYDRFCSKCGSKRIHRSNQAGMCPDCYVRHIGREVH